MLMGKTYELILDERLGHCAVSDFHYCNLPNCKKLLVQLLSLTGVMLKCKSKVTRLLVAIPRSAPAKIAIYGYWKSLASFHLC